MTTTLPMKIGALAPWFGGKRTLAPRIVAELGTHRVYWELFAGGMPVLLAKAPCVMETVNDLHGDIINLARVVQSDELAPRLFDRIARTAMHEVLQLEAADRLRSREKAAPAPEAPDLDRAYDYMVCCWLGRNGVAGVDNNNFGFCVRYTANGGHAAKRFQSVAESIPAWWQRLRNVTILNRNARALLKTNKSGTPLIEDRKGTSIYADPPYVEKGARYVHDFSSDDGAAGLFAGDDALMTHGELAEALRRYQHARVVVSYYDHPKVRELYKGWTFVDCSMTKSLANQHNREGEGVAQAPEVLIINGPSLTEGWEK